MMTHRIYERIKKTSLNGNGNFAVWKQISRFTEVFQSFLFLLELNISLTSDSETLALIGKIVYRNLY